MYSKYNHSNRCPRCRITLEYIYTKDYVDEFYCPECKVSEYRTLERSLRKVTILQHLWKKRQGGKDFYRQPILPSVKYTL